MDEERPILWDEFQWREINEMIRAASMNVISFLILSAIEVPDEHSSEVPNCLV